jgi:diguanylate cyclase (GGDEF)-like protein
MESLTDHLTGAFNRRAWDKLLDLEESRCKIYGHSTTIIVIDLNDLKYINDTFGHLTGDNALIACYDCINLAFGKNDNNYRIGGDEFICILIDITQDEFLNRIELLKQCISEHKNKVTYPFNIAAGYAVFDNTVDKNLYDTFNRADKKMYDNKYNIKNYETITNI